MRLTIEGGLSTCSYRAELLDKRITHFGSFLPDALRILCLDQFKILDKERLEPPHVTVRHAEAYVANLSSHAGFLVPPGGNWGLIDSEVREIIEK